MSNHNRLKGAPHGNDSTDEVVTLVRYVQGESDDVLLLIDVARTVSDKTLGRSCDRRQTGDLLVFDLAEVFFRLLRGGFRNGRLVTEFATRLAALQRHSTSLANAFEDSLLETVRRFRAARPHSHVDLESLRSRLDGTGAWLVTHTDEETAGIGYRGLLAVQSALAPEASEVAEGAWLNKLEEASVESSPIGALQTPGTGGPQRARRKSRRLVVLVGGMVLALIAAFTVFQLGRWTDPRSTVVDQPVRPDNGTLKRQPERQDVPAPGPTAPSLVMNLVEDGVKGASRGSPTASASGRTVHYNERVDESTKPMDYRFVWLISLSVEFHGGASTRRELRVNSLAVTANNSEQVVVENTWRGPRADGFRYAVAIWSNDDLSHVLESDNWFKLTHVDALPRSAAVDTGNVLALEVIRKALEEAGLTGGLPISVERWELSKEQLPEPSL